MPKPHDPNAKFRSYSIVTQLGCVDGPNKMIRRHIGFLVLFLLFSAPISEAVPTPEKLATIAESKTWLRLLHYKSNLFGSKSQVDDPGFFFAKDGNTDPLAELKATTEAFYSRDLKVGRLKQHPQCAFPQRLAFLQSQMTLENLPSIKCEKLDEYLQKFSPHSLSLIFSTAYAGNPGSMFGHTFLRANSKKSAGAQDSGLNDLGISYAAVVSDDENPLAFIYFGITGGYLGQFSLLPYYVKVSEYNHAESRDLWEY